MRIQIAENIKKFRIASGYTQSELAILLSVSHQAVSRWENGQALPDITFLPLLAKYLNVSIDVMIGFGDQKDKNLEKELYERKRATIEDESEKRKNQQRILEIYEELAHTKIFYLVDYFQYLMCIKSNANSISKELEERFEIARQMIRDCLRTSNMCDRMQLLSTIASYEDEEKLTFWLDEYELPEYMKTNFWDELLLSRYDIEKNADKFNAQNQKILYNHIKNTIYYLTDSVSKDMKGLRNEFQDQGRYKMALDTLSLYSEQVDDIFIFDRIIAEVRYADALLTNGYVEKCLEMFALATEHLLALYQLPEGSVLHGSVPVLNSVHFVINGDDKLVKCVLNIGGYDKNPLFDKIREDKRFIEFVGLLEKFFPHFPQRKFRSFVNEKGRDIIDAQWEMLLNRASKEVEKLSDGEVVVILTAKGTVDSISFQNIHSASEAENAMKFLIEKKKSGEDEIERLICMWHDGSIDFPSYSFREALVAIDSKNLSTQMLLNGLNGYVIKTVKETMPKGYKA
ncbi:MAG: helix-turn-helix transcriptional regulator [Ruminococcaceae bacterium]|nr:helix-turn-helix transcriptional regulator [Oscillospiraceae bacterium]